MRMDHSLCLSASLCHHEVSSDKLMLTIMSKKIEDSPNSMVSF